MTSCASTSPRASRNGECARRERCDRVEDELSGRRRAGSRRSRAVATSSRRTRRARARGRRGRARARCWRGGSRASGRCRKRPPSNTYAEHALLLEQQRDRVGELELAADAGLDAVEHVEDLGREHVAADHREVRRRLVARRLLDDAAHSTTPSTGSLGLDAAVRRDLVGRHFRDAQGPMRRRAACTSSIERSSAPSSTMMSSPSSTANGSSPTCCARPTPRGRARAGRAGGRSGCRRARSRPALPAAGRALPLARGSARARSCGRSGPRWRACRDPVMMRMSVSPACTASSTTYWIAGLSTTGSISFGWLFVAGRNRVPSPAAGMTALRTLVVTGFLASRSFSWRRNSRRMLPRAARRSARRARRRRRSPRRRDRRARPRTGTRRRTSNDASDALCKTRATITHTTARPSAISG